MFFISERLISCSYLCLYKSGRGVNNFHKVTDFWERARGGEGASQASEEWEPSGAPGGVGSQSEIPDLLR
jgi:hypothetical protein